MLFLVSENLREKKEKKIEQPFFKKAIISKLLDV